MLCGEKFAVFFFPFCVCPSYSFLAGNFFGQATWQLGQPFLPSAEHDNRSAGNQQRYKKSIFWSDKMKIPLFIGEYHSVHVGAKASTAVFDTFCKAKTRVSCHACSDCRLASRMIFLFWWTMLCPKTIPSSWGTTFLSTET